MKKIKNLSITQKIIFLMVKLYIYFILYIFGVIKIHFLKSFSLCARIITQNFNQQSYISFIISSIFSTILFCSASGGNGIIDFVIISLEILGCAPP